MKQLIFKISVYAFTLTLFAVLGCSDQSASKQEFIAVYNEFATKTPSTLGEGTYPLTANFSTEDKGKEGMAQALVSLGFLSPVKQSEKDKTITFQLTEIGKKYYDATAQGFVWGRQNATAVSNIRTLTVNGQEIAYVTLTTTVTDIPDWAKQPVILANYPIVKETLNKNEFHFNATYKRYNNRWLLADAAPARD